MIKICNYEILFLKYTKNQAKKVLIRRKIYLFKSHQYLVGPPLLIITASKRLPMLSTRFSQTSFGMEYQAFCILLFKSEIREIALLLMRRPTISHRFSMGFKSEDWATHGNLSIPFSCNQLVTIRAVCFGSLSC